MCIRRTLKTYLSAGACALALLLLPGLATECLIQVSAAEFDDRAAAADSVHDIVFDLDLTLVYRIPGAVGGPGDPLASLGGQVIRVRYWKPEVHPDGRPKHLPDGSRERTFVEENYRLYPDTLEVLSALKRRPSVRISFFSAGSVARSDVLLSQLVLDDGATAKDSAYKILGEDDLTRVSDHGRYREMFRKNLKKINPDTRNLLMVDDIDFALDDQRRNWLFLPSEFPYAERLNSALVTGDALRNEAAKLRVAGSQVLASLERAETEKVSLVDAFAAVRSEESARRSRAKGWACVRFRVRGAKRNP